MPNALFSQEWVDKVRKERAEIDFPYGVSSTEKSEFHLSLDQSVQHYVKSKSGGKGVTINSTVIEKADKKMFMIFLYIENTQNLSNCVASSRNSTFLLKLVGNDTYALQGSVVLHSHAFEHGNIQLSSKQNYGPAKIKVDGNTVDKVVQQIDEWESSLLSNLREMYGGMGDGMLKSMRRIMPITRTYCFLC